LFLPWATYFWGMETFFFFFLFSPLSTKTANLAYHRQCALHARLTN
jgi:hypothetical protein